MSTKPEIIRHSVRQALALRPGVALTVEQVTVRLMRDGLVDTTPETNEVKAALILLEGLGHVRKEHDELGATEYWQITSPGIIAYERERFA
jgi:hypothetical protein